MRRAAARGSRAHPSSEVESLDAVAMLMRQHRTITRRIERLADEVALAGPPRRRTLLELADALAIHIAVGERHFYPALRQPSVQLGLLPHTCHRRLRRVLSDLLHSEQAPAAFAAAVRALALAFARHVAEEERRVFPAARAAVDVDALDAVGQEMMATMTALEEKVPREVVLRRKA